MSGAVASLSQRESTDSHAAPSVESAPRRCGSLPRETRIALVCNGGVSLAVWMGGVTYELDLLRRASTAETREQIDRDDPALLAWWDLTHRGDAAGTEVVVDIVAGTSAGGVNGALLSAGIARGAPLTGLKALWRDVAQLAPGGLIPAKGEDESVLSGEFFLEQLDKAFDDLTPPQESAGESDVTLFTTATATGDNRLHRQDSKRHAFSYTDHRRVYRLRQGTSCFYDGQGFTDEPCADLSPASNGLLADLARASASFPIAFRPIEEPAAAVDTEKTRSCGCQMCAIRVCPADPSVRAQHLCDGGILDNSPFGPVLDEIARRPYETLGAPQAARPVERWLVYVVPSNGVTTYGPKTSPSGTTDPIGVLTKAIMLPRETDFRLDVADIEEALGRSSGWDDARKLFCDLLEQRSVIDESVEGETQLLGLYRRTRLAAIAHEYGLLAQNEEALVGPGKIDDDELNEMLQRSDLAFLPPPNASLPSAVDDTGDWPWGVNAAVRISRLLLGDLVERVEDATLTDLEAADLHRAAVEVDRGMQRLLAMREALSCHIRQFLTKSTDKTACVNEIFANLRLRTAAHDQVRDVVRAYGSAVGRAPGDVLKAAVTVEVVTHATQAAPSEPTTPFTFLRVGPDVPTAVLDSPSSDERKLYGTRFGHFGAFGSPEWRMWDWMMGRLDAAEQLGAALGASKDCIAAMQRSIIEHEAQEFEQGIDGQDAALWRTDPVWATRRQVDRMGRLTARDMHRRFAQSNRGSLGAILNRAVHVATVQLPWLARQLTRLCFAYPGVLSAILAIAAVVLGAGALSVTSLPDLFRDGLAEWAAMIGLSALVLASWPTATTAFVAVLGHFLKEPLPLAATWAAGVFAPPFFASELKPEQTLLVAMVVAAAFVAALAVALDRWRAPKWLHAIPILLATALTGWAYWPLSEEKLTWPAWTGAGICGALAGVLLLLWLAKRRVTHPGAPRES